MTTDQKKQIINFFEERPVFKDFYCNDESILYSDHYFIVNTFVNRIDGITLKYLIELCEKINLYCSILTIYNNLQFKFQDK